MSGIDGGFNQLTRLLAKPDPEEIKHRMKMEVAVRQQRIVIDLRALLEDGTLSSDMSLTQVLGVLESEAEKHLK